MDLRLSDLGENIIDAQVAQWLVDRDSEIVAGQDILEVVTDKAVFTVSAPADGRITAMAPEGSTLTADDIVCNIT